MSEEPGPGALEHRGVVLDERDAADAAVLAALRATPGTRVLDRREHQRAELARLLPAPGADLLAEPDRWVHYPWRGALVGVLGPRAFRRLRLDRNRNKVTEQEQERLGRLRVAVVGLSVGHAVAHTLALEGLCGQLRLADHDTVDLSNLNRIPAGLLDLGENKAVVAARRIAELDPYLDVVVEPAGATAATIPALLDGLDVLVEECDSLDVKVALREAARERGVPVLMETSDRGLLDVERFDLEPDRPVLHGLLGGLTAAEVAGLPARDKVPHLVRLLDAAQLSARMAASVVEVGRTLSTWPQLGGDVTLGAATVAAAVRRLGLGAPLASGRVRVDLDARLDALATPVTEPEPVVPPEPATPGPAPDVVSAVLRAVRAAPSGGNVQPWRTSTGPGVVRLHLAREATTAMDVGFRGSHVALGAALHNARVAAAAAGALGPVRLFPAGPGDDVVAELALGTGADPELGGQLDAVLARATNRRAGTPAALDAAAPAALQAAAEREGARVHLLTDRADVAAAAEVLAAADRVRYLTAELHRQMVGELRTPGRDSIETGIDLRTLELAPADLATLGIVTRGDVVAHLASWEAGEALGADTRARVAASSAVAVVTVTGTGAADYVRGGAAAEAVWVAAERAGLAVAPVSPVFLYALDDADRAALAPHHADELAALSARLRALAGVAAGDVVALVLRLSHAPAPSARSRRLPAAALVLDPAAPPALDPAAAPAVTVGHGGRGAPAAGRREA